MINYKLLFIDVIGICQSASELQTFMARSTGRELKKKEVTLIDQSKTAVILFYLYEYIIN